MRPKPAPTVSVALCTRNGARFVGAQVRSILDQSPAVSELVVSDDASSDDTLQIVEDEVRRSGLPIDLRVMRNDEPLGVTANFEQAIAACTRELVALSDQDDVWHPGRLAAILPAFDDADVMLVHTDADLVDADGRLLGTTLFQALEIGEPTLQHEEHDALGALLRRNLVTGATVVFRRRLVDRARPFPDGWVHDEWLAVCAAILGTVRPLRSSSIDYRQHGANEIGVRRPTLRYKIDRIRQPGAARQRRLARQFDQLAERLPGFPELSDRDRALIERKARFEAERARFPRGRAARVVPVIRLLARGGYARFASQGRMDVVRDLVRAD